MEHQCHHCGCVLEEGVPFCPRCGSPQIRVVAESGEEPPGFPGEQNSRSSERPAAFRSAGPPETVYRQSPWNAAPLPQHGLRSRIDWRAALPGAAITGILSGVFLMSRIGALAIVLIPLAGYVTVQLYRRRTAAPLITSGMGAKLGGFCGLFAFLVVALAMTYVFTMQGPAVQELLTTQMASRSMDPAQAAMMHRLIDTPDGRAVICIAGLIFMFPIVLIMAVAGGALAAAMSGRNPHS